MCPPDCHCETATVTGHTQACVVQPLQQASVRVGAEIGRLAALGSGLISVSKTSNKLDIYTGNQISQPRYVLTSSVNLNQLSQCIDKVE